MSGARAAGAFAALLMASVVAPSGNAEGGSPRAVDRPDLHLPRPVDSALRMSVMTTRRGHGPAVREGDRVRVLFSGKPPSDGASAGTPFDFVVGSGKVIAGWDEGLDGMKVGEKRRLVIPPALAYGSRGRAGVMPGETLTYEVELLAVLGETHDD